MESFNVINSDGTLRRLLARSPTIGDWSSSGLPTATRSCSCTRTKPKTWKYSTSISAGATDKELLASGDLGEVVWLPDGEKLAYTVGRWPPALYVMNVDGSDRRRLAR